MVDTAAAPNATLLQVLSQLLYTRKKHAKFLPWIQIFTCESAFRVLHPRTVDLRFGIRLEKVSVKDCKNCRIERQDWSWI